MKDKIKEFYDKVDKYGGWSAVPASRVSEIFMEATQPERIGFTALKPGLLAQAVDSEMTRVIKLQRLKGDAYTFLFGLSLTFVPYPYEPQLKWHRTQKSLNLDLCEWPHLYWGESPQGREQAEALQVTSMLREKCLQEEIQRAWAGLYPLMKDWFERTSSRDGILKRCDQHLARPRGGVQFLPGARLVKAFTLAKAGMREAATRELERFFEEYREGEEARKNLYKALDQIISETR